MVYSFTPKRTLLNSEEVELYIHLMRSKSPNTSMNAEKNNNTFPSREVEKNSLIYNYNPRYTGANEASAYEQIYGRLTHEKTRGFWKSFDFPKPSRFNFGLAEVVLVTAVLDLASKKLIRQGIKQPIVLLSKMPFSTPINGVSMLRYKCKGV
ncbi:hypothetical protein NQ317_017963 [Molorchus minor]|uniref:Uncharacterized protein n=1 Tax=Molorchus minor TaxID=1323400 RepID=A0ABQ9JLL0_9CUCU|nr:hypothetical protein NQ317_017963 [Molorchus minor]